MIEVRFQTAEKVELCTTAMEQVPAEGDKVVLWPVNEDVPTMRYVVSEVEWNVALGKWMAPKVGVTLV